MMMPGWMMSGWGMGFGLFGWLMMLLFWILIIVGAVLVVRWFINEGEADRVADGRNRLGCLEETVRQG